MATDSQTITNEVTIALALIDTAAKAIPVTAPYEPIIALLLAAAARLSTVIGTDVTYSQLEGLRVKQGS